MEEDKFWYSQLNDFPQYAEFIEGVLLRLPEDVQNDVFENCQFLILDEHVAGQYLPEGKSYIVFPEKAFAEYENKDLVKLILHEIAHHWNWATNPANGQLEHDESEALANKISEQWFQQYFQHLECEYTHYW